MPLASDGGSVSGEFRDWQRVHPASPFLDAGRLSVVAFVLVVQQGVNARSALLLTIGLGLLAILLVVYAYAAWRARRFRIGDEQLEFRSGILFREVRRLPIARIEAVEVVQPAVARLLGLSEVRVQAASSGEGEVRLQYLAEATAWRIRDELRSFRQQAVETDDGQSGETEALEPPVGRDIFKVNNADLFWGYIMARAVVPTIMFAIGTVVSIALAGPAALGGVLPAVVGVASFLFSTLKVAETNYNFTLYEHPDGLFIHRGLFNKVTQRVSLDRVQSIAIQEPYFWRRFGRARLLVDIAGFRSRTAAQGQESAILVPIAKREACLDVLERVLPGLRFTDVATTSAPPKARWLEPLGRRYLYLGANGDSLVTGYGIFRKVTVVVPHRKVQSWRVTAGPIQQRLGLATLRLDTAGSHIGFAARHRTREEAHALVDASRQATHSA